MKIKHLSTLALVGLMLTSLAATTWAKSPRMKMTTDIPPEIVMPDRVETRLGTLRFFDGYPDAETTEKLYKNLDFVRGVQAYLSCIPGASMHAIKKSLLEQGTETLSQQHKESVHNDCQLFPNQ